MWKAWLILGLALTAIVAAAPASAQYPERPINYIVPYSPGGGSDVGVRTWTPFAAECLGNNATFTVVNMPGATGAIGVAAAEEAPGDGYTLVNLNLPQFVTNPISKGAEPDIEDFDYLGTIVGVRSVMAVRNDSEFKTLEDFVNHAKGTEEPINVGIGGLGADDHLAGLRFQNLIDEEFTFIPFGDGASSRNALLGGQVEVAMMSNSEAALFKDEIRPLAVAGAERTPLFPDTPTFREAGYEMIAGSDHVIGTKKGAPPEVLEKLRTCIAEVSADPAFLAEAEKRAMSLNIMDAAATEAFVRDADRIYRELWAESPWVQP